MHELALTESVISIVNSQQEQEGFSRVLEIRLRVGEYSGIVPDCLREFFPIAAKDTAGSAAVRLTAGREFYVESLKVE